MPDQELVNVAPRSPEAPLSPSIPLSDLDGIGSLPEHSKETVPPPSPHVIPSSTPSTPVILIVDDEEECRIITREYLSPLAAITAESPSSEEAIDIARRIHPAVIVSDWMMPGKNGLEFCQAIRADSTFDGVHFLLVTARDNKDDLLKAFECGVDDFLLKPFSSGELRARVQVGLRLNALYQEMKAQRRQAETNADNLLRTQKRLQNALTRLDDQIREIADLQASFLPTRFPPMGGLVFSALCRPCRDVGGDYYDVFSMPDGRICFTIADVTGHGARAAVCMAMTRSLTRAAVAQLSGGEGPSWILNRINSWLCTQLISDQFVTMWIGVWDPETACVRYARAGHPVGIFWPRSGDPIPLSYDGVPPLGLIEYPAPPMENVLPLNSGDRLVLHTDGLTESHNTSGKMLDIPGLIEALKDHEGLSLDNLPLALYFHLERFVANAAITDDVSLLILERSPQKPPSQPIPSSR